MTLIVLPVYNEENVLKKSCLKLLNFCKENLKDDFKIVIADNASNDRTGQIGKGLDKKYAHLNYFYVPIQGKGTAIGAAFKQFEADYYGFMDIDLATGLEALPRALSILKKQGTDMVIGSRYHKESKLKRSFYRIFVSKIYNLIVWVLFGISLKDLAIGFKFVNKKLVKEVLPKIKNKTWFFDSELVILSHFMGFEIKEIPIIWHNGRGRESKVNVLGIAREYLKEMVKLRIRNW